MKVNQIFEGNNMEYSYFPGGYFDSTGAVHYTHTDYQGSIIAVTDSLGKVVQTVGYYPYGEPWREPSGQPMLFAGKERTPQADYLFGPRTYNPSALFWHAPDRKASSFTQWSPYAYCGGNPIGNIDPSGNVVQLIGAILVGAAVGGATDYYAQIGAYMWVADLSYDDAKKEVDQTSVVVSAITGAFGGVLASVSHIPTFVNNARTIKNTIAATEAALEAVDAAVDYSENKGLSAVGLESNPKSLNNAGLDVVGSFVSSGVSAGAVKVARQQALENVSAPTFSKYIGSEQAHYIGVKSFVDGNAFQVTVNTHNKYLLESLVQSLNKKMEEK